MRPIFTQSYETKRLVELFADLPLNFVLSFKDASDKVGFKVRSSLAAYQSAKKIAERDHGVVIEGVRNIGFVRIDGSGMVKRAPKFFKSVRRRARREAHVQEIAISTNLTRNEMIEATEQLSRLRILETTAIFSRAKTNREITEKPDTVKPDSRDGLKQAFR